jgi:hypothetical protein
MAIALVVWSTGFAVVVVDVVTPFGVDAALLAAANGSGVRVGIGGAVVGGPRIIAFRTCWASNAWFSFFVSTLAIIVLNASGLTDEKLAAEI